jgi:benzoyl-CoA reductase subunit B
MSTYEEEEMTKYPTKKYDCWQLAKEMQMKTFEDVLTARERGKIVLAGTSAWESTFLSGLVGFDGFAFLASEAYGGQVAFHTELQKECIKEVERRGYAPDLCSYMRNYWGSAFLDRSPWGKFPHADLYVQPALCDTHPKWITTMAQHLGVPCYVVDLTEAMDFDKPGEHHRQYFVDQGLELIQWLEKQTGREFDDERFIEAVINYNTVSDLWAEICDMLKAVPCPMDMKSQFTLNNAVIRERHSPAAVRFMMLLRDEMKERVAQGIAAVGNERCRLIHDNCPAWYALHIFRYMEKYGVVCVGGHYGMGFTGSWAFTEDGSMKAIKTVNYPGWQRPRSREEALRLLDIGGGAGALTADGGRKFTLALARDWNIDGGLFHLNRGCEGWSRGRMEVISALREMGLPVATYEGSTGDMQDWNEAQVMNRIDSFMERLGLTKLEDQG